MAISVTPVFNRKKYKGNTDLHTVNIRVTLDRKSIYLPLPGFPKIAAGYWDLKNNKVKSAHPDGHKLNYILKNECQKIHSFYIEELSKGAIPQLKEIRNFYIQPESKTTINDFIKKNIRVYCNTYNLTHRTYLTYQTMRLQLEEFAPDVTFHDFNRLFLEDFVRWLRDKKQLKGTSIQKSISRLGRMLKEANKQKLFVFDPLMFDRLPIKSEAPRRVSLDTIEIKQLLQLEISCEEVAENAAELPQLNETKDFFLFMCMTGLYFSDLKELSKQNITQTKHGSMIEGHRGKTGIHFAIPVYKFPHAHSMIKKALSIDNDLLFPNLPTDQEFNRRLKKLQALAQIKKNLTIKVARHSFADLMVSKGYERSFVSRMMGHRREETTQIYYSINAAHIADSKFGSEIFPEF